MAQTKRRFWKALNVAHITRLFGREATSRDQMYIWGVDSRDIARQHNFYNIVEVVEDNVRRPVPASAACCFNEGVYYSWAEAMETAMNMNAEGDGETYYVANRAGVLLWPNLEEVADIVRIGADLNIGATVTDLMSLGLHFDAPAYFDLIV